MNKTSYNELIAFHPGYYVKELIEDEGMSQEELAKRIWNIGFHVACFKLDLY